MYDRSSHLKRRLTIFAAALGAAALAGSALVALASLTFSGTSISGDGSVVIDASSTISIGTSTATGITIGQSGQTVIFPGNISAVNLFVSGNVTVSSTIPAGAPTGSLAAAGNVYAGSPTAPQQLATLNAAINAQTDTTYTLQASDNGEVLTFNNASNITLTIPAGLGAGFNCLIVQLGAGTVTPTSSGTTIYQRQSLTQTAGQYAIATLVAPSANTFILSGDLQ